MDANQASSSAENEKPATTGVIEEVKTIFQETVMADIEVPSFRTNANGDNSHFRFNLDNLLSTLKSVHELFLEQQILSDSRSGGVSQDRLKKQGDNLITTQLDRCNKACIVFKDTQLSYIFSNYALAVSPRSAWWACSTNDWISRIDTSSFDLGVLVDKPPANWKSPYLPVAGIYREALGMREQAEAEDSIIVPDTATASHRIAKHFYLTMLEAMRLNDNGGEAIKARVKQCEKRLGIVCRSLDESVDEGEDFLEVLLGNLVPTGPDGQKIDLKTIKKALGVTLRTDQLHQLFSIIPSVMENNGDPDAAREALMKQPLVKEMMQSNGGSVDQFMGLFNMLGMMKGDSASTPLAPGATPSSTPLQSAKKVKVRGSMKQ